MLSLVLSSLNAAKVIDTQLSIFRLFRLLRLLKVAIAVQRVKGRTEKFRKKGGHGEAGPPTCNWESAGKHRFDAQNNKMPAPTAKYSAFLSHYKMEAAADARYLEQHLEAMTNTNVFIDSNDLVDLEKIFEEGVLKSEMIVLLGTKGVLTRPWCLLELYEARRHDIPVVTFAMSAHGFTPAFARAHLLDDGGLLTLTLTLTLTRWAEAQATRRCGGADLRVHRREPSARGQAGHVGALRRARDRGEGRARGQGLGA